MLKNRDVPKELKFFNSLFFEFQYKFNLNQVYDDLLTIIICALGRGTQENLYFETIKATSSWSVSGSTYTKCSFVISSNFGSTISISKLQNCATTVLSLQRLQNFKIQKTQN